MPKHSKGYCLVTETGAKYHANTVTKVVTKYVKDSLNPFTYSVPTGKDYDYKFCIVCKDGSGRYFGDSLAELLTAVSTHRLEHLLSGEGWRD